MHSLLKEGFCAIVFGGIAVAVASISEEVVVESLERRDNVTLKAPVVATPSQHWFVSSFASTYFFSFLNLLPILFPCRKPNNHPGKV